MLVFCLYLYLYLGSFKFCDLDGDGWITRTDLFNSIELIHQLMGNMFQLNMNAEPIESDDDAAEETSHRPHGDTFTPENRTNYLFKLMDEDEDGRADYTDFKRTVLNDAEIIQGFLVYDGVI